ncbi:MAG: hypothetical protein AB7F89_11990 [Pirellulaceae bacterium]
MGQRERDRASLGSHRAAGRLAAAAEPDYGPYGPLPGHGIFRGAIPEHHCAAGVRAGSGADYHGGYVACDIRSGIFANIEAGGRQRRQRGRAGSCTRGVHGQAV